MQELHGQLEELLELERQAKRDEEVVRNLQATYVQHKFTNIFVVIASGRLWHLNRISESITFYSGLSNQVAYVNKVHLSAGNRKIAGTEQF